MCKIIQREREGWHAWDFDLPVNSCSSHWVCISYIPFILDIFVIIRVSILFCSDVYNRLYSLYEQVYTRWRTRYEYSVHPHCEHCLWNVSILLISNFPHYMFAGDYTRNIKGKIGTGIKAGACVCAGLDLFPLARFTRDAENQYGIFSFRTVNSADMNFSADRISGCMSRTRATN